MTNRLIGGSGPTYVAKPLEEQIAEGNSRLMAMGRHDVHWFRDGNTMLLGWKPERPSLRIVGPQA